MRTAGFVVSCPPDLRIYGNADSKAPHGDFVCTPVDWYGASKWMRALACRLIRRTASAHSCQRSFNASGADEAGAIGEKRHNETHLIPRAMMAAQGHVGDPTVFRK